MIGNEVGLSRSLEDLPGEEWKLITGFENRYYISTFSRVLDTHKGERILNKYDYGNRYVVRLKDRKGRCRYFNDFLLTANAFLPKDPLKKYAKLKDGNYKNGHISNIYFARKKFNKTNSKLTEDDLLNIKDKRNSGFKLVDIAKELNVSTCWVSKIVNNKV